MTEYILRIAENKQSPMLLKYLKSLDYVSVVGNTSKKVKSKSVKQRKDKFINFLQALPQVDYTEQEVNSAINEMRKVS